MRFRTAAFTLTVFSCFLFACAAAPVYVYVTPAAGEVPSGELLPVEAQRVIDRATATAAAVATDAARETAVRLVTQQALQDARDAATLSAAQTQSALDVALQAGAATQAVQATAGQQTQAAGQTQAWATPTWAALHTQAAAERAGIAATATQIAVNGQRSQAGADAYRNLWGAVVAVGTLAMLVLAGVLVYWTNERQKQRTDTQQQMGDELVERDRLATERAQVELQRVKLELMRDLMIERDGRPWLLTDGGRLVPMMAELESVSQSNMAHTWRWRAAIKKVVYAGLALGADDGRPQFGERDLAGEDDEHCWVINLDGAPSSTGYRHVNKILRRLDIWITAGRDTVWGPGWDELRFEREFDRLPLPELPTCEPPDVRTPPRGSAVSAIPAVSAVPQSGD